MVHGTKAFLGEAKEMRLTNDTGDLLTDNAEIANEINKIL